MNPIFRPGNTHNYHFRTENETKTETESKIAVNTEPAVNSLPKQEQTSPFKPLNDEIALTKQLLGQLTVDNEASTAILKNQLEQLIKKYKDTFGYMLNQKYGQEQLKSLIASLYLQSEEKTVPGEYKEFLKKPTNIMVATYCLQHSLSNQLFENETSQLLKKLFLGCSKYLFWLEAAQSFLKDYRELTFNLIKKEMTSSIVNLKKGESLVLPGGWPGSQQNNLEGHFFLYLLRREENQQILKIRFNTHPLEEVKNGATINAAAAQILNEENAEAFATQLLTPYFPEKLAALFPSPPTKTELLNLAMQDTKIRKETTLPIVEMEPQRDSANCTVIPWYALYKYILAKNHEEQPETLQTELRSILQKNLETLIV